MHEPPAGQHKHSGDQARACVGLLSTASGVMLTMQTQVRLRLAGLSSNRKGGLPGISGAGRLSPGALR